MFHLNNDDSFFANKSPDKSDKWTPRLQNESLAYNQQHSILRQMDISNSKRGSWNESNYYFNHQPDNFNNTIVQADKGSSERNSNLKEPNTLQDSEQLTLLQLIFNMKLKMFAKRLVNNTRSRMFINLTQRQYKLIDDKSWLNIGSLQQKQNSQQNNIQSLLKKQHSGKQNFSLDIDEEKKKKKNLMNKIVQLFGSKESIKTLMNKLDKSFPVFNPSQFFKGFWDSISMLFIIIYFIQIPLYVSFLELANDTTHWTLIILTPFYVFFDAIINLNSGYFEKGLLINKRSSILLNHWKKYSATELFIIIAYLIHIIRTAYEPYNSWSRFFLCSFALKIKHLNLLLKKLEEFFVSRKSKQILDLTKLLFVVIILTHLISVFWVILAQIEKQVGTEVTWLNEKQHNVSDWKIQYIEAYYFSIVTMATVGYGDILPITPTEKVVSVILMIVSGGLFAYSMNTVGNILDNFNYEENELSKKMQIINRYMSKKNVNKQMQYAVREYLDYYWREASERDQDAESKILSQLSDSIRENLLIEANKIVLKQSSVFRKNFSQSIKQKIIPLIKEYRCTPEEMICVEGDIDDCSIFFIEKGSVEIFIETQSQNNLKLEYKTLVTLKKGESFGELSFFTGMPRTASVRSKEFTTLLMIKRDHFLELLEDFSEDFEQFCTIKDSIKQYNDYSGIDLKCYSCQSSYHILSQCPYIHFKANSDKLLYLHNKNIEQQRIQYERSQNVKINSYEAKIQLNRCAIEVVENNMYHPNVQLYTQSQNNIYSSQQIQSQTNIDSPNNKTDKQIASNIYLERQNLHTASQNEIPQPQPSNLNSNLYVTFNSKSLQNEENSPIKEVSQHKQNIFQSHKYNSIENRDENMDQQKSLLPSIREIVSPLKLTVNTGNNYSSRILLVFSQYNQLDHKLEFEFSIIQFYYSKIKQKNFMKGLSDLHQIQENEPHPNFTNYTSLSSVEKISPLVKKIDPIHLRIKQQELRSTNCQAPAIIHFRNQRQQKKISNWSDGHQNHHLNNQRHSQQNSNKSNKDLMQQLSELLKSMKNQFDNKPEKVDYPYRKRLSLLNDQQINIFQQQQLPKLNIKKQSSASKEKEIFAIKEEDHYNESFYDYLNIYGESVDDFDLMKNYDIYFPYNNLSYQLQLMNMNKEDKKSKFLSARITQRNYLPENSKYSRSSARGSFKQTKNTSIAQVAQKYQKEMELEQSQFITQLKKSKFNHQTKSDVNTKDNRSLFANQMYKSSYQSNTISSEQIDMEKKLDSQAECTERGLFKQDMTKVNSIVIELKDNFDNFMEDDNNKELKKQKRSQSNLNDYIQEDAQSIADYEQEQQQKDTYFQNQEKYHSSHFNDDNKSSVLNDDNKSSVLNDDNKHFELNDDNKSSVLNDDNKPPVLNGDKKSSVQNGDNKSSVLKCDKRSSILNGDKQSSIINLFSGEQDHSSFLIDDKQASRLQQVRMMNKQTFDIKTNQIQQKNSYDESFNIKDQSPTQPINHIHNNIILNQQKIIQDDSIFGDQ